MLYNLEKLNEISDGDKDFIQSVVDAFVEEIPVDLKVLQSAVNAGDFNSIYQISHKIKPNLDLLGMDASYGINLQILEAAKSETNLDQIRDNFKNVNGMILEVIEALKRDYNL